MEKSPRDLRGDLKGDRDLNESPESNDAPALSIDEMAAKTSDVTPRAATGEMDSMSGTTIGHYTVGERLGGGAMAAVYRAHDELSGDDVAIKLVLPGADAVMQARFRREARMVSTLIHPHIVRTLQVGRSSGIVYIAMELVEGTTLAEVLDRHGKLGTVDAARILAPVAEALEHAHSKGIVHRDVKPSNILLQRAALDAPNSVKIDLLPYAVIPLLSDFGIARALDAPELTNAGRTIGTPAFMAPEQCAGSAEIDGRADIYALGAVFYRCLVGRAPFSGSTTQILHAHVYDPLLIPDEVAETLPGPVVQLLARAMMKEPAQRFATMRLMAEELQRVVALPPGQDGAADGAVVDSTMTMASLPVAKGPKSSTSRVLVPAVAGGGRARDTGGSAVNVASSASNPASSNVAMRPSPLKAGARQPLGGTNRTVAPIPPPRHSRNRRRGRGGMVVLISALAVLVLIGSGLVLNSFGFGRGDVDPDVAEATATPAAVAAVGTPETEVARPSAVNGDGQTVETPVAAETVAPTRPTAEPTEDAPTPSPQPPLQRVGPTWELALASFDEGDWQQTVSWLILIQRSMEFELPDEDVVDAQQMNEMLITSYLGLATNAAAAGGWDRAIENLEKAAEIAPREALFAQMIDTVESLAELQGATDENSQTSRDELRTNFADLQVAYAARLANADNACYAVTHVGYAIRMAASEDYQPLLDDYQSACRDDNATASIVETGGVILYSSEADGGAYSIYQMPITEGVGTFLPSTFMLGNGAQPSVSPNGGILAYYSWAHGNDGLYGVRLNGLAAVGGGEQFSPNPEDSRDSPPSWDVTGTSLAFSTGFVNQAARIYVTPANGDQSVTDLGYGKDPAWRPYSNIIVFNGPDPTGQNVGLKWITTGQGGADRSNLTSNGNDQRPVWSSDGRYLVFMSQDRAGVPGWEIYRLEWASGEIIRLTDGNGAQDGLPAISPDNNWVAFMSDRGGEWNLYYVSIDGGEVHFLSSIVGQPLAWLEHSIQWVP